MQQAHPHHVHPHGNVGPDHGMYRTEAGGGAFIPADIDIMRLQQLAEMVPELVQNVEVGSTKMNIVVESKEKACCF